MKIPLIGGSYTAFSSAAAMQESINCYPETLERAEGKGKVVLRGIPGIHLFKDLTTIHGSATPIRGLWSGGGRLFVVAGTRYLEVDSAGSLVGSSYAVADDAAHSPAQMFANSRQLLIVSAQTVYCDNGAGPVAVSLGAFIGTVDTTAAGTTYNVIWKSGDKFDPRFVGQTITINALGYTVAAVTNPELLRLTATAGAQTGVAYSITPTFTGVTGAFLDGYGIVSCPSSRQFNISAFMDFTSWDGLDFDLKSGWPDNIQAVYVEKELLYLMGTETIEIWRNTGNPDFPFERVDGGFIRMGLAATWSVASINGQLHFLGMSALGGVAAYRMEGASAVRVSTHSQEEAWAAGLPSEGVSFSYLERGHWHWVINFAGNTRGHVYDATEQEWHQRARWDSGSSAYLPYRPWFHTFIPEWGSSGKHIVGDYLNGKLYEMSADFFDDDSLDIRAVRTMAHLYSGGKRLFMSRVEIEHEAGLVSGGGNAPVITLDWSNDRGHTFAGGPVTLSSGASGAYTARAFANRLGSFRDRVMRLVYKGQSKIAIIDANAEIQEGLH